MAYQATAEDPGPRGTGGGVTFAAWRGEEKVSEAAAAGGEGSVRLALGDRDADEPTVVYLPEVMHPRVAGIAPVGGAVQPAPPRPRWVAYGDSVLEGWVASEPALGWGAIAAREQGLDLVNLGYAGAARGEVVSAEHVASLPADVIAITHGTNCWSRIPHSAGMVREGLIAFLDLVRAQQPETPIVVVSPVVRPDAEESRNVLGATLADLRAAMEAVVGARADDGDANLELIPGRDLIREDQLADGLHPNDDGHRTLADAIGPRIRALASARIG